MNILEGAKASTSKAAASRLRARQGLPRLREASLGDYDAIAALEIRNGLAPRPHEDWVALWNENPVGKQVGHRWPIGWVLENESGEIVGSIGNIPLAYHFMGRKIRAITSCAWAVDPNYRSHSLLLLDRLLKQVHVDLFVFTTVSPNAEPVFKAFQFSRVPAGTWHKAAFWITNYRGFSQSALSRKAFPLAKAVSYPVSAALYCLDGFKGDRIRACSSASKIELCAEFDSRFDDFWEELKGQNHNVLLALRTQETLAWHFRSTLLRQKAWILAISKGSRLTGYAIFDRQDNATLGLKRVRLVDFQALRGSEDSLRSALGWMLTRCREEGVHLLEVTGCWLDRLSSPQIRAPHHRTLPSWAYYYKATDRDLGKTLKDPKVWVPSSFDGDASL